MMLHKNQHGISTHLVKEKPECRLSNSSAGTLENPTSAIENLENNGTSKMLSRMVMLNVKCIIFIKWLSNNIQEVRLALD